MLDRLKTLPLTIVLTILIWMYAEAQFTSTRDPERVARLLSPSESVPAVPVYVAGPPALLALYDADIQPNFVPVTVTGSVSEIDALRERLAGSTAHGIYATLELTFDDRPTPAYITRPLHYSLPDGLTLQKAPTEAKFRLVDRAPASAPAKHSP